MVSGFVDRVLVVISWASAAKEYVQWAQQTSEKVKDDRYFGDSVDAVQADKVFSLFVSKSKFKYNTIFLKARLDADDKTTTQENSTKKAAVDKVIRKQKEEENN